MQSHEVKGRAASIVSSLLIAIVNTGIVEQALVNEEVSPEDIAAVKSAMMEIANDNARSAAFHKSMMEARQ